MARRTRSSQRGFTLIELIACVVILGILAAIAAPRFVTMQAFTERGYADDFASSLRYARRIAIASSCRVQVTIDAAGYAARQQASCNSGAWTTPVLRSDGTQLNGTTPSGINITSTTLVEFVSTGATTTGSAAITVGARTVNVAGATGRVSVQ
jgi:MSHA pilin protein MshC